MANQVAARLAGDDYQHLFAWFQLLELLMPGRGLRTVTVEDPAAAHVDDVTMVYEPEAAKPDQYFQVKYHVDQRSQYSTAAVLKVKANGKSLLRKFYDTWNTLRGDGRTPELRLVTNWSWDRSDPVCRCIRGQDNSISTEFLSASPRSALGEARELWREHLSVDENEFSEFVGSLRLHLGFDCIEELEARVAERMENMGLRHDRAALVLATGIVRNLVKQRRGPQRLTDVEVLLTSHSLYLPVSQEPATTVYLSTIKQQRFEIPPDYLLNWRAFFEGDERKKGHRVLDPSTWNDRMLPELLELEAHLNEASAARLIRVRGLARLSAWFAFGHTFSDVARYTVEVDQQGRLWRTDAVPSGLVVREHGRGRVEGGDSSAVAVGISVTGSLEEDVRAYLRESRSAGAVLFLRPDRPFGRECFGVAADVAAFARGAKDLMRSYVKELRATRLLLFYFGPLSGACFLGHQLNAVAREVQIMEYQQLGYDRTFLLR